MPSKQKSVKKKPPTLQVRECPADLLGRINGAAELLGVDRDEFVIELLRQELALLERMQDEVKEWWAKRMKAG